MRDYFNIIKRYRLTLPVICIILLSASIEISLLVITKLFQLSMQSIGSENFIKYFLALIVINTLFPIMNRVNKGYRAKVKEDFTVKYSSALYRKVQRLSVKDLEDFSIPKLTTEIQCANGLADNMLLLPCTFTNCFACFSTAFVLMAVEDWKLTLILMTITSFTLLGTKMIMPGFKKMVEDIRNSTDRINQSISHLDGYLVTKSFAKEDKEISEFNSAAEFLRDSCLTKFCRVVNAATLTTALYGLIEIVIVLYIAATYDGNLVSSVSKGLLFYTLYNYLFRPFDNLPTTIDNIQKIMVHLKTDEEILRMEDEYDGDVDITEFNDSIEFKNVSFAYNDTDNTLNDINVKIPKGTHVGIYGKSGSGKSTFVNLINRFFLTDKGEILIDGVNINQFTSKSLRKIIGNVNQEITLFSDMTIRDNIKYGINCTDVEMVKAAKLAHCHEFIKELPDGYDSKVGNNGVKLSGGERQRIAIARLFLLNPPILVLDEATSKLDSESEFLIKESIEKLSKDKKVISIAHRFNTIENSDLFIGIKDHTIYDYGTKEDVSVDGTLWTELTKKRRK